MLRVQCVHDTEVRGVDELSPLPALRNQAGALQVLQMERERRRNESDAVCNAAGRKAVGTSGHQQPIDREAVLVCECTECGDDLV